MKTFLVFLILQSVCAFFFNSEVEKPIRIKVDCSLPSIIEGIKNDPQKGYLNAKNCPDNYNKSALFALTSFAHNITDPKISETYDDIEEMKLIMNNCYKALITSSANISNYDVMYAAVKQDGCLLAHANEQLNNIELIKMAIQTNSYSILFVPDLLIDRVIEFTLGLNGKLLYLFPRYKSNEKMVEIAIQSNGNAIKYSSYQFKKSEKMAQFAVINDGLSLVHFHSTIRNNEQIVRLAIDQNPEAYQYIGDNLKDNLALARFAIRKSCKIFDLFSEEIQTYLDIIIASNTCK